MAESTSNDRLLGAVAYLLGIISGVVLLLVEKKSKFVRFHAMQSTITFGVLMLAMIALNIVPILGQVVNMLLSMVTVILWLVLMIKAFQGEKYMLPVIGDLAEQQLAKME